MELNSIIAIGLVVFIVAGLVFLYVRNRKKEIAISLWAAEKPPFTYP